MSEAYSPSSGSDTPLPDLERRSTVRHPTSLETYCRPLKDAWALLKGRPCLAVVANLSGSGVGLLTDRPFDAGTLLAIELRSVTEDVIRSLVIRVVHATVQPDGRYLLGGIFVKDFNDEDVPVTAQGRVWERFACEMEVRCRALLGERIVPLPAEVVNVSPGGVALRVGQDLPRGARLQIELLGIPSTLARPTMARVLHVTPQADGHWLLGCTFADELTDDELQALID